MLGDDPLRAAMQVARARVITEPAPVRHHRLAGRPRQRAQIGEAAQEALIIGDNGRHLGLLQHDLG